jgi:hypothetical protein
MLWRDYFNIRAINLRLDHISGDASYSDISCGFSWSFQTNLMILSYNKSPWPILYLPITIKLSYHLISLLSAMDWPPICVPTNHSSNHNHWVLLPWLSMNCCNKRHFDGQGMASSKMGDTPCHAKSGVWFPVEVEFVPSPSCPAWFWGLPWLLPNDTGGLLHVCKAAEIEDVWNLTSMSPWHFWVMVLLWRETLSLATKKKLNAM